MAIRGKIQTVLGTYGPECIAENDLIQNQAVVPEIRDMLDYVQGRQMVTLITNGSVKPYGIDLKQDVKLPMVETSSNYAGKGIGANAYNFRIMGRIEQPSVILSQVGASGTDGTFSLKMGDRRLNKGSVVLFYGGRYTAVVMSQPRMSAGGYIYDFQNGSNEVFNYATVVATQPGLRTCFAGWTSFGEKSLKGYGETKFPDMFTNHMTIQRNSVSITGDAASRVLWYKFTDETGKEKGKGWMYEEVSQQRAKFSIQNERQKLFGVSNMKNADGSLKSVSNQIDPETGLPITAGDGIEMQIANGNVVYGSGVTGQATIDDLSDLMSTMKLNGNMVSGYTFYYITGTIGYNNFQKIAVDLLGSQNVQLMQSVEPDGKPGSSTIAAGYTFNKISLNGDTLIVAQHPMFDDALAFPERGGDGKLIMSGTGFLLNFGGMNGVDGKNIEILHKEANGINRAFVEATLTGMTGAAGTIISQEDAMTHAILRQDMINVYDSNTCGVLYPTN